MQFQVLFYSVYVSRTSNVQHYVIYLSIGEFLGRLHLTLALPWRQEYLLTTADVFQATVTVGVIRVLPLCRR